jgi:NitT/TauT family transport system ATP-binding protein
MNQEMTATAPTRKPASVGGQSRVRVEFKGVAKVFRQREQEILAVRNMSFALRDQEFVSILGPSGCGKSTTLKLISGLDFPNAGSVELDGEPVRGPSRKVGFMLQKDLLLPWRTILENVTIGLEIRRVPSAERNERARSLINKYGLGKFENAYPRHLSGGMRQRAALARTLAADPEILLLDEPLSALDYQTKLKMEEELVRILREERKTVLLITHDIAEAVSVSDRVLVCSARPGHIKAEFDMPFSKGHSPKEARNDPNFQGYFNQLWNELEADVTI